MLSRPLLRLLRSLPKPVALGAVLAGAVVASIRSFPDFHSVREPAEVLLTGLTGYWVASWSRLSAWRLELLAGMFGALLVAGFYLALSIWLQLPPQHAVGLTLLRATLVGALGAWIARLLRQRAAF